MPSFRHRHLFRSPCLRVSIGADIVMLPSIPRSLPPSAFPKPDGGHILRMRGSCLSRQLYVEAVPPGQNPCDSTAEATEDALAPQKSLNGEAEGGATGRAGLQVRFSRFEGRGARRNRHL